MIRKRMVLAAAAWLFAAASWGYVVVLKDGNKIFARSKYSVKGTNAIITLENGNITQIPLSQVDVAGSDSFNKENVGNVIPLQTPKEQVLAEPPVKKDQKTNLSQFIRQKQSQELAPKPRETATRTQAAAPAAGGDPVLARETTRILEMAGVTQYRLAPGPKVTFIANDEDSAFRALNAAAKLIVDLSAIGKASSLEVTVVTSNGEDGGHFKMTPDSVGGLTSGTMTASEFFVKNVLF